MHENRPDDVIAVVSHGGLINQLCRAFLRLPVDAPVFWSTGDTGVHEWLITGNDRRIVRSNSLAHLDTPLNNR